MGHCKMLCPVRAFDGRHRISFGAMPFFVRTSTPTRIRLLHVITIHLDPGICRIASKRHECLRLTTIFTYGFTGRVCTLDSRVLRGRKVPFRIVLPLVSRATNGMRRLSPARTRANPTMHCSRGMVDGRLRVLTSRRSLRRLCRGVDGDVRGLPLSFVRTGGRKGGSWIM